jgi:hypothetical protein
MTLIVCGVLVMQCRGAMWKRICAVRKPGVYKEERRG